MQGACVKLLEELPDAGSAGEVHSVAAEYLVLLVQSSLRKQAVEVQSATGRDAV